MTELTWEGKYQDGKRVAPVRIPLPFQTIETINESKEQRATLFAHKGEPEWRNRLIWGDKKYVLPSLLPEFAGKVNLIYIDPPFDTGANFSFTATIAPSPDLSGEGDGGEVETTQFVKEPSIIEQKAYRDTWGKGIDSYIDQFYKSAGIIHDLLTEDGALYVHLDWRLVHYVKVAMDEIFGYDNFMANIIWKRIASGRKAKSYKWLAVDDIILVYTKGNHSIQQQYAPYSEEYKKRFVHQDKNGIYFWDNIGSYSQERLKKLEAEGRVKYPDNPNAGPRIKNYLHEGKGVIIDNIWTDITPVNSQAIEDTNYPTQKPEALLERIIKASSNENDLVLDCFCGSGTTAAVAEKLNRRWITCDLGRFAIHTTRKRLLSIEHVKPFVVQNLGKYERQQWVQSEFHNPQERINVETTYREFILNLYKADAIKGYTYLHGVKAGRMVHVGGVEAPVSMGDVKSIVAEFWKGVGKPLTVTASEAKQSKAINSGAIPRNDSYRVNGLDVLGWEFAFELNETASQFAASNKVDLKFKKIPREVLEKKAVEQGDIKFFELAYLDVKAKATKGQVSLAIKNFVMPPDDIPDEVRGKVTHWSQWIDYWAVDWNYRNDTFHNEWQSYRTRQNLALELSTTNAYEAPGEYTILVKVIDILGNDTTKLVLVKV